MIFFILIIIKRFVTKKKKDSYPLRFIIILLKFQNYGTLVLEYGFVIGLITLPFLCISAQPFKYDSL